MSTSLFLGVPFTILWFIWFILNYLMFFEGESFDIYSAFFRRYLFIIFKHGTSHCGKSSFIERSGRRPEPSKKNRSQYKYYIDGRGAPKNTHSPTQHQPWQRITGRHQERAWPSLSVRTGWTPRFIIHICSCLHRGLVQTATWNRLTLIGRCRFAHWTLSGEVVARNPIPSYLQNRWTRFEMAWMSYLPFREDADPWKKLLEIFEE